MTGNGGRPLAIGQKAEFGLTDQAGQPDEGVFTHTLHTAMIEREGNLAANLEGNKFTAVQLGDLVQTVIGRRVGLIGWR